MARHSIRALGGIALAGACLALAACSSSGSPSSTGPAARVPVPDPVKTGTVTVKEGDKVICVMTVVNGRGTCAVPASSIGVGTKTIVGDYSGKGNTHGASEPLNVTVVKATTQVSLSDSSPQVTFGDEQAARVTVKVTAAKSGVPTGSVTVYAGPTRICTIKLVQGTGSCTLGAQQLKAGSRSLYADYSGDAIHFASGSKPEKITIAG
jgi:hypothetical protein